MSDLEEFSSQEEKKRAKAETRRLRRRALLLDKKRFEPRVYTPEDERFAQRLRDGFRMMRGAQ
jgi:hypothetical protein